MTALPAPSGILSTTAESGTEPRELVKDVGGDTKVATVADPFGTW
jgi:hypothetical protein